MLKFDPKIKTCWVDCVSIGFGISMYACFSRNFVGPIGFVWGTATGDRGKRRFDVLGSYVMPWARRKGVRTKINEAILSGGCDVIATVSGTEEGGAAFMKAFGYKHDSKRLTWTYVKPKRRRKRA